MRDEVLFGAIAVQEKFISAEQLDEGLRAQAEQRRPLGEIFRERGVLTGEQVAAILDIQRIQLVDVVEDASAGGLFGQIAIRLGLATPEQVHECVRDQKSASGRGESPLLGRLLVERRYLTEGQFIEILRHQEKHLFRCPFCSTYYLVEGYAEGTKFLCRRCVRVLTVPYLREATVNQTRMVALEEKKQRPVRMTAREGESMGPYVILSEAGRGPNGVVLKAVHRETSAVVALKVLTQDRPFPPALQHPGIVAVRDAGKSETHRYLATEWVDGAPLSRLLSRRSRDIGQIAGILEKAARVVAFAHEKGLLHLGLKPANIIIDESGAPRITDFSLGGLSDYSPPELRRGEPGGPAADIYGLGMILYEALAQRLPSPDGDPPPPRAFNAQAPVSLETVCLKAVEREPADRFASAGEFADELRRHLDGKPILTQRSGFWGRLGRYFR